MLVPGVVFLAKERLEKARQRGGQLLNERAAVAF
jgi:hypothetical protein